MSGAQHKAANACLVLCFSSHACSTAPWTVHVHTCCRRPKSSTSQPISIQGVAAPAGSQQEPAADASKRKRLRKAVIKSDDEVEMEDVVKASGRDMVMISSDEVGLAMNRMG